MRFDILKIDRKNTEGALSPARFFLLGAVLAKSSRPPRKQLKPATGDIAEAAKLNSLRQRITELVAANALEMVATTIDQVKEGQYQALKYLFEMIGLYPATGGAETPQEDSLAKILLDRLGISASDSAEVQLNPAAQGDAVE